MKKATIFLSIAIAIGASETTDIVKSMYNFKKEQTTNIALAHQVNNNIVDENKKYYSKISQKATAYYSKYISSKWGDKNVKLSNISTFTQYNDSMDSRESVDFKNGVVTIEVLSSEDCKIKSEYFDKTVKRLSTQTVTQAIKKDPVNSLEIKYMKKNSIISQDSINNDTKYLDGYIDYIKITDDDVKLKEVILKDGETKYISYIEIQMVPEYLKKRALKYKPYILQKSREYGIEPSIIFATIQTESYFNPMAKSHVPAYGLMQIVPTAAGVDSYYALTNEYRLLSPSYLYNANNNINIGSKYIQIVRDKYLNGINDPLSKFYCAATSYNAGIGSLIYSFTGSKFKRAQAIDMINSMTPQRVYYHLRTSKRLTHEARNYVKSIKERVQYYQEWDKEV